MHNTKFDFNIRELELVEDGLRALMVIQDYHCRSITALLGKIHNQKKFYRPKDKVYISG